MSVFEINITQVKPRVFRIDNADINAALTKNNAIMIPEFIYDGLRTAAGASLKADIDFKPGKTSSHWYFHILQGDAS